MSGQKQEPIEIECSCCLGEGHEGPCCPGWGHFNLGEAHEGIERCDDCARFANDVEAARAHEEHCGCGAGVDQPIERCHACSRDLEDENATEIGHRIYCDACARAIRRHHR